MSNYRERLSANAEEFDSIVHDMLIDYEASILENKAMKAKIYELEETITGLTSNRND